MTNAPSLYRDDPDRNEPTVWRLNTTYDEYDECPKAVPAQTHLCEDMMRTPPLVAAMIQFSLHRLWRWDELLGG